MIRLPNEDELVVRLFAYDHFLLRAARPVEDHADAAHLYIRMRPAWEDFFSRIEGARRHEVSSAAVLY